MDAKSIWISATARVNNPPAHKLNTTTMARPKRGNYAYGPEGDARYKKNLREYLKKQKEAREKKTKIESTKKNISKQKTANKKAGTTKTKTTPKSTAAKGKSLATAKRPGMTKAEKQEMLKGNSIQDKEKALKTRTKTKKPVTKKPVAKKPVAKKPVAKQPAKRGRPVGSKNKPRLRKQVGNFVKRVGKGAKDLSIKGYKKGKGLLDKSVKAYKNTPQNELKKPETKGQKAASGLKNLAKRTIDFQLENARKAKTNIKDLKNIKSNVGGSALALGASIAEQRLMRLTDRAFKGDKTLSQYRKDKDAAIKKNNKATNLKIRKGVKNLIGNTINKVRGKGNNNQSSTTKNINKQKNTNNKKTNNTGLKIKKTERSSSKNTNKDYNAKTATKTHNPNLSTFRVDPNENRKLQLEIQNQGKKKNKTETYSRQLSPQAKKQVTDTKTNRKEKPKSKFIRTSKGTLARRGSVTARRAENRERARKRVQELARQRRANK